MLYYLKPYYFDSRYNEYFETELGEKTADDKVKAIYYDDRRAGTIVIWDTHSYTYL